MRRNVCLLGFLIRFFPDSTFRDDAFNYARDIANGPSMALGMMKKNLNSGGNQSLASSLAMEAEHLIACMGGDEAKEAITAFMEKRAPNFDK